MHYIIDGNNLAGKLGILFEDNFDQKMIGLVRKYFIGKKIKVSLVFDSLDLMGDIFHEEYLDIIYTPRDRFYKNADDKIVELVKMRHGVDLRSNFGRQRENIHDLDEVTVVTDDIEIKNAIQKVADEISRKIYLIQSTDFALKILNKTQGNKILDSGDTKDISDDDVEKINNEFLKLWK